MEDDRALVLNEQELALLECVKKGTELNLGPGPKHSWRPSRAAVETWPDNRVIRASVIRGILIGRYSHNNKTDDPHGVQIYGAVILGLLDLKGVRTTIPLSLTYCYVKDGVNAEGCELPSLTIKGSRIEAFIGDSGGAAVSLKDAKIHAGLNLSASKLMNISGCAFNGEGMHVESDVKLNESFTASGKYLEGTISLPGASIGGQLSFTGAKITNEIGPALFAEGLSVAGDIFLRAPFRATATSPKGVIRMTGAHIGGQLIFAGSYLINHNGPAISANSLTVDSDLFFTADFYARGDGKSGVINLVGAKVGGHMYIKQAILRNDGGRFLVAPYLQVGQNLHIDVELRGRARHKLGNKSHGKLLDWLRDRFFSSSCNSSTVENPTSAFDLRNATVFGDFSITRAIAANAKETAGWSIDGMTYRGCPVEDTKRWTEFLVTGSSVYAAQPFRFFAQELQRSGHDFEAHRVLIWQRKCRLKHLPWYRWRKIGDNILYITLGYGYRQWLAVAWLVPLIMIALGLVHWWFPEGLVQESQHAFGEYVNQCSPIQRGLVAIDMTVPLVVTGASDTCTIAYGTEQGDQLAKWATLLKIPVWALASLFVAGFTNLVRRS